MKRILLIPAMAVLGCGTAEQRLANRALRDGGVRYNESAYVAADSAYAQAGTDQRCVYNRGNAAFRLGSWSEAIAHYTTAAGMDTGATEQARARFGLGNAHYAEARDADSTIPRIQRELAGIRVEGQDIAEKLSKYVLRDSLIREVAGLDAQIDSSLSAAIANYKAALRHAPADDSLRFNLVLAQRQLALREAEKAGRNGGDGDKDKDQALSARAQLLMQHADSLVEIYRFRDALDMLQRGLQQDPTLKSRKDYMDKLDLVTKAASVT